MRPSAPTVWQRVGGVWRGFVELAEFLNQARQLVNFGEFRHHVLARGICPVAVFRRADIGSSKTSSTCFGEPMLNSLARKLKRFCAQRFGQINPTNPLKRSCPSPPFPLLKQHERHGFDVSVGLPKPSSCNFFFSQQRRKLKRKKSGVPPRDNLLRPTFGRFPSSLPD